MHEKFQDLWLLNQLVILQRVTKFGYAPNVTNLTMGALRSVATPAVKITIITARFTTNHRAPVVGFITLRTYSNFVTLCIDKMSN